MIIVDSNERDTVTKYFDIQSIPYERQLVQTDDGIGLGDYTNTEKSFLVERKSASDFRQSLTNGHILDQLSRIVEFFDGPAFVIFEGNIDALVDTTFQKGLKMLIQTFFMRLAYIYGIQFIWCDDACETADMLVLLNKYTQGMKNPEIAYPPVYAKQERDERVRMLMVTPMLGQKGAKVLLDECGSIEEVLRKAREEPKSLIKLKGIGKLTVEKLKALLGGKSIFSKYSKTKKKKPTVTKEERIANIKQKHAIQKSMYSKLSGGKKK